MLILLLVRLGELENKKSLIKLGYALLTVIFVIRFDIGNDYENYAIAVNEITAKAEIGKSFIEQWLANDQNVELAFYFFSCLFSWMPHTYVVVIGMYSLITILLLYKSLDRERGYHMWGLLMFIISGIMFCTWDWVRQSVAIMVVLYAFKYIEQKKLLRFLILIAIGMLFHKTIILVLPFYFVSYIKIHKNILVVALFVISAIYVTGFFDDVLMEIMQYADFIDGYRWYANSAQGIEKIETLNYKLRSLFYVIVWASIIFTMPSSENQKRIFLFLGGALFLIVSGSLALTRIAYYFIVISVVALPCSIKNLSKTNRLVRQIVFLLLITMTGLWIRDIYTGNNRGCTPYDTVFSDNYTFQKFRKRNY
ncbi:MAG: EpsG family protein [Prevotella sp.]|nr:EpsG family protein [Prevotella sp.]